MRESFGKLAQAAVEKLDTIDPHAATIAAQAKAIAELTATNVILVMVLAAKAPRTITLPQGFTAQGAGTANTMGHTVNTAGVACRTKKNKKGWTTWVVPQNCSICGKKAQWHIPTNCRKVPCNAALKTKILASRATDKAVEAVKKKASN